MRPQFHHIDAKQQMELAQRKRGEPAAPSEPRALQMVSKTAEEDDINTQSTSTLLEAAGKEKWARLRYYNDQVCTMSFILNAHSYNAGR